ncbi:hypothetical protein C0206_04395 [Moraxella catarrhalis]|uniref:hypothetical protein n=1 Tax=Moraxella catarrhalis TaxID=480 RepID=UPI00128D35E8|nr:hypothetical protein [Moraxella catarrhalis]MPX78180.1 hypothetical protein [Moraxella catarrhalis]
MEKVTIPTPYQQQLNHYCKKWKNDKKLENYRMQEQSLNKLFHELLPLNNDISEILIKSSVLNDFYSTNIFTIYPVAKKIQSLDIDKYLKEGDADLVMDIKNVTINGKNKNFYSFATKYYSHHDAMNHPIYDAYVDKVLRHFRHKDKFYSFKNEDLKDYCQFKRTLIEFQHYYKINCTLKDLDRYLWLLGKAFFNKYKSIP